MNEYTNYSDIENKAIITTPMFFNEADDTFEIYITVENFMSLFIHAGRREDILARTGYQITTEAFNKASEQNAFRSTTQQIGKYLGTTINNIEFIN